MKGSPVIVVGAGAAGLAAAYTLRNAGCAVKLLEADEVVGGKLRSKSRDGYVLDQGAYFMPTTHRRMMSLAADAGFADIVEPGGSVLSVLRNRAIHEIDIDHVLSSFMSTKLFSTATKLSLLKLAGPAWLSRKGGFDGVPALGSFDTETAEIWARRELNDEIADYVVGLVMRGMSATSPDKASRVEFLCHLATVIGTRLVACRGGMGAYAERLAAGIDTELSARVTQVEKQGDQVRVSWRDRLGSEHVEIAAGCVMAASTETAVQVLPQLDGWRRNYLSRTPDKRMFLVNIGLTRPPKNLAAMYVLVPRSEHPNLSGVGIDHNKARSRVPPGKGLVTLVPIIEWSDALCEHDDERIVREGFAALDKVLPGVSETAEFTEVTRWRQRFNPVGHYRDLGHFRAMCEQDTTVQLAGDYFGYANLESAFRSGENAARNLLRMLAPAKA